MAEPPWTRDQCEEAIRAWLKEAYGFDPEEVELNLVADDEGEWSEGKPGAGTWSGHWVCDVRYGDEGEDDATLYVHADGTMEGLY